MADDFDPQLLDRFVRAAHNDPDTVRNLLKDNPALLNAVSSETNETAIQAAAHSGERETVEFLMARGAPVDICTSAMLGDVRRVGELLQQDPSRAHATGGHGVSLLYHACLSGNPDVAELVAKAGDAEDKDRAMHAAVLSGKSEMVNWLLSNGVQDINLPNDENKTPLTVALDHGYFDIADMIQSEGGVEN